MGPLTPAPNSERKRQNATKYQRQKARTKVQQGAQAPPGNQQPGSHSSRRIPLLAMACAAPMRAYKASTGRLVFFKKTEKEYHQEPYTGLQIPCGTCILCREEQARQQAVRITHEATQWEQNSFITLTYNEDNLPDHGSLRYKDLVTFWKRLRKQTGKLRYYAVGEYGDKTLRPHYHACIFGHDFTQDSIICQETPHRLWINLELTKCWGMGDVKVGMLNFQTARYTASYVTKKLRSKQKYVRVDQESGELIPVEQPRAFMSRNLGLRWWEIYGHQLKDHDHVIIDGQKQKPPKMYDRWLTEQGDIQKIEEIKRKRIEQIKPNTQTETHARARNAHARAQKKKSTI
ncbi:MAG: replication initiator protein [Microvirus sp.]|nr:MAG: replication initiator protein [Microvirus sp.]